MAPTPALDPTTIFKVIFPNKNWGVVTVHKAMKHTSAFGWGA